MTKGKRPLSVNSQGAGYAEELTSSDTLRETLDQDFLLASLQQQAQFWEEEKARCLGEDRRREEFERFLVDLEADARNEEKRCEDMKLRMLQDQETSYTRHAARREERFLQSQSTRKNAFANNQGKREADAVRQARLCSEKLEELKASRKEIIAQMEVDLQAQRDRILPEQESAFLQSEKQFKDDVEERIRYLLGSDPATINLKKLLNNEDANNQEVEDHHNPFRRGRYWHRDNEPEAHPDNRPTDNDEDDEQNSAANSEGSNRSSSSMLSHERDEKFSYSAGDWEASSVAPDLTENVVERTGSTAPRDENTHLPQDDGSRAKNPDLPAAEPSSSADDMPTSQLDGNGFRPTGVVGKTGDGQNNSVAAGAKSLSRDALRQDQFNEAEKLRQIEFDRLEWERDQAEEGRNAQYQAFIRSLQSRFHVALSTLSDAFVQAEKMREFEEKRREEIFKTDALAMQGTFESFKEALEGAASLESTMEDELVELLKSQGELLLSRNDRIYEKAGKERASRFKDSEKLHQKSLRKRLGVRIGIPNNVAPLGHSLGYAMLTRLYGKPDEDQAIDLGDTELVITLPETPDLEYEERPIGRYMTPPTGLDQKAVGTLFAVGDYSKLPVPDRNSPPQAHRITRAFSNTERQTQYSYDKSKDQRAMAFTAQAAQRQSAFVSAEIKRDREFQRVQTQRRMKYKEELDEHVHRYMGEVQQLLRSYAEMESHREESFNQEEESRMKRFNRRELEREERFRGVQMRLTCKCFEAERGRMKSLSEWAFQSLEEAKTRQVKAFEEEEAYRDMEIRWMIDDATRSFVTRARASNIIGHAE